MGLLWWGCGRTLARREGGAGDVGVGGCGGGGGGGCSLESDKFRLYGSQVFPGGHIGEPKSQDFAGQAADGGLHVGGGGIVAGGKEEDGGEGGMDDGSGEDQVFILSEVALGLNVGVVGVSDVIVTGLRF